MEHARAAFEGQGGRPNYRRHREGDCADAGTFGDVACPLLHCGQDFRRPRNWLFEGEVSHREADANELVWPTPVYETLAVDGSLASTAVMANAWYNIDAGNNWTFYLGGGVGAADVEAEFAFTGYYDDYQAEASDSGFAWQLGVGASYRTESGFAYGFGYRYFNIPNIGEDDVETDIVSHDFIFEVSRRF